MWIELSKLVLCFFFCSMVAYAYESKLDYIARSDSYSESNAVNRPSYNYKVSKSRYPHLDKVNTRIHNMNAGGGSTKEDAIRFRHKGWSRFWPTTTTTTTTEDSLFETYGELADDDDTDDYDALEDEDDELDYEDDTEGPFSDELMDVQAEEPTERPTVAPKPMSRITQWKWVHLGTKANVTESRRNHLNISHSPEPRRLNAVVEHSIRVNEQGKCRTPSPKVINVQKEHPDASKAYTPHCTVLHRCGEDTGCCKYETTCLYKSRDLVHLYFYATTLGTMETKVVKLGFYNHTECECRKKSNKTSTEEIEDSSSALSFKSADTYNPSVNVARCKCSKHFAVMPSYRYNSCNCDCEEENLACIQLKKGNEHLSMTDRICISNNECTMPSCEYGPYSSEKGKCPSITEKRTEFKRMRVNY